MVSGVDRALHDDGRDQVCEDKREYEHGSQEKNRVRPVKPERKIRNPDGVKEGSTVDVRFFEVTLTSEVTNLGEVTSFV